MVNIGSAASQTACFHAGVRIQRFFPFSASAAPSDQVSPMFSEGDLAVYPAHGVGVIKKIETQSVGGADRTFYVLEIIGSKMLIMVPTASASCGLRALLPPDRVDEVIGILEDRSICLEGLTWNRRYREYMDKIKTGSLFEVAAVLRDLFLLSIDKDLSYGEKKMFDTAKNLVVTELSLVQREDENAVAQRIERIFS